MHEQILEEFQTRVDINDPQSLRRFFLRYSFFNTNDLAQLLILSPTTIRFYKRFAGLRRKGGPATKPRNPRIPVQIEVPENWDVAEWWRRQYPRYGMSVLVRATGLNYQTVRRRVKKHCGRIRSHREAMRSTHPCCTREWLQEHYIDKRLSQKACARIAGVSDSTLRGWLVRLDFQVRNSYGRSLLDQVGGVGASQAKASR